MPNPPEPTAPGGEEQTVGMGSHLGAVAGWLEQFADELQESVADVPKPRSRRDQLTHDRGVLIRQALAESAAWKGEARRLTSDLSALHTELERTRAENERLAEECDEHHLMQMSAQDSADAERIAELLGDDFETVYIARAYGELTRWCVFYAHRRAAFGSPDATTRRTE